MPRAWHAFRFRPEVVCGVEGLASSFDFLVDVGVEKAATINVCWSEPNALRTCIRCVCRVARSAFDVCLQRSGFLDVFQ